jgi:1-aminocyclopropane-1-carboxylate deaminase/D-cysteine desulfhydrase-like pyridoxal-dependent ACC family enzyme
MNNKFLTLGFLISFQACDAAVLFRADPSNYHRTAQGFENYDGVSQYNFIEHDCIPLFIAYPSLEGKIPHRSLGHYPTPLLDVSGRVVGCKSFYIKDDGQNGFFLEGTRYPEENKNRKLEFLLADAVCKGFTKVATVGCADSNHACQTAYCAKLLGLDCTLFLEEQWSMSDMRRNLLLDQCFGAGVIKDALKKECEKNQIYFIPGGGSTALGALGYVNAMFELRGQLITQNLKDPDMLYVTLGSAGTAAGIIVGAKLAGFKTAIYPVSVCTFKPEALVKLIKEIELLLSDSDSTFKKIFDQVAFVSGLSDKEYNEYLRVRYNVVIINDLIGEEYAAVNQETASAINFFYLLGNKLDGTYTGKTAAACLRDLQKTENKDKRILFWNTFSYGTFNELTSQVAATKLP